MPVVCCGYQVITELHTDQITAALWKTPINILPALLSATTLERLLFFRGILILLGLLTKDFEKCLLIRCLTFLNN